MIAKRNGFSLETPSQLLLLLLPFADAGGWDSSQPDLTGVTWAKPNSVTNDSSAIPEHNSSPNISFFPLEKMKADPEADVAASAGQEATLLRNRNPGFLEQA